VAFGINGFTGGTNAFKISRFERLTDWQADYDRFYISFLDRNFYFAAVFPDSSRAVSDGIRQLTFVGDIRYPGLLASLKRFSRRPR
jgi:hypothetical protein